MTWLSTQDPVLSSDWDAQLPKDLLRGDNSSAEWINLNTGASIVLVPDGGWRGAQQGDYPSRYRVFHRTPQSAPVELTFAFLEKARNEGQFDQGLTGNKTYLRVRESCIAEIERILSEH